MNRLHELDLEEELERLLDVPLRREKADVLSGGERDSIACFCADFDGRSRYLAVQTIEGPVENVRAIQERAEEVESESSDYIYLLAAPYLTEGTRSRLEATGVNYVDFSGHALVRSPGLLIRIDTPRESDPVRPRVDSGPNPFAKKASFVLRLMLENPARTWGVRETQRELPLSLGHVSNVLHEAARRGYVEEGEKGFALVRPERLLAHWSTEYRWDDNEIYSFQVAYEQEEIEAALLPVLERQGIRAALTLLAGSDRVVPSVIHDQMHFYVEETGLDAVLELFQFRLQAEPVSRGGNVHILQPYYREATFFAAQSTDGLPVVSDVQLFLDLAWYPLRGHEAARKLLRTRLGPKLNLSDEASEWLAGFIGEL